MVEKFDDMCFRLDTISTTRRTHRRTAFVKQYLALHAIIIMKLLLLLLLMMMMMMIAPYGR